MYLHPPNNLNFRIKKNKILRTRETKVRFVENYVAHYTNKHL